MKHAVKQALAAFVAFAGAFCFLAFADVDNAEAGKWKRKSQEHYDQCNAWCAAHPDVCTHCSTLRGCGEGYDTIQSWTGYGKNWHACKKRLSREEEEQARREECEAWCARNPDCERCSSVRCGRGRKVLQRWTGRGFNQRACGKRQYANPASNRNRDDCYRYCREESEIRCTCSTNKHCGVYSVAILSWKGKGRNFHACADREDIKNYNKTKCVEFCRNNPDVCVECKPNKNCGQGLSHLKTFKLGNNALLDYHACKKRTSGGARLDGSSE